MAPYIVLCVVILIVEAITHNKWAVCFGAFGLWFLLAFRNLSMGLSDTLGTYRSIYNNARFLPWSQVMFSNNYPRSFIPFVFFTKFCQLWIGSYKAFVIFLAFLTVIPVCYVIYRYSVNPTISLFIYIGIFYGYDFYLLRQMLALSVIVSICYPALWRRHFGRFLMGAFVAACVHPTAAVVVLLLPFACVPFTPTACFLLLCISLLGAALPSLVIRLIGAVDFTGMIVKNIGQGIYSEGSGHIPLSFLLYASALFLCLISLAFYVNKISNERLLLRGDVETITYDKYNQWMLWSLGVGVLFQGFVGTVVEFYRIALYFLPAVLFLVPKRIEEMADTRKRDAVSFALCILMASYALAISMRNTGCIPYRFSF